jgi:hypothetical protein
LKIKFSTNNELALNNFPPIPAGKLVPDWYKNLSLLVDKDALDARFLAENDLPTPLTIKGCVPVKDYITSGYIIRTHTDILITPDQLPDEMHSWWWKAKYECLGSHTYRQCPVNIGKGKNTYMKYINPWMIKTPPGYSCLFYQPEYFFNEKIKVLPGIVDTDTYDANVNFPFVVMSDKTFMIKCGDPIMVVMPFKRDDWSSEVSFAGPQKDSNMNIHMLRGYLKMFHKRKTFK